MAWYSVSYESWLVEAELAVCSEAIHSNNVCPQAAEEFLPAILVPFDIHVYVSITCIFGNFDVR